MKCIGMLCILMLFLCGALYAEPTVWYVHPDSALNTIQAGLDSCADNDIVLVGPGTYYENIIWPNTKGIDLISEFGADTTIIDGNGAGCVVTFNNLHIDTTTVIQGLTIQNGYDPYGGGIFCDTFTSPMIVQNTVRACTSLWYGGGILLRKASPYIIGNTISDNHSTYMGGGIGVIWYSTLITRNNTITRNSADWDGGGVCLDLVTAKMVGDTITLNHVGGWGDGIGCVYYYQSPIFIEGCVIANNLGHGIYAHMNAKLVIHYCSIMNNSSYGVYNLSGNDTIDAEYNWWGDSTGPYHPSLNPSGLGNPVSSLVDFIPWLGGPTGMWEKPVVNSVNKHTDIGSTIFNGPLLLPEGKNCRVFDITGRVVLPQHIKPGIYFIEVEGVVIQKVVKVR